MLFDRFSDFARNAFVLHFRTYSEAGLSLADGGPPPGNGDSFASVQVDRIPYNPSGAGGGHADGFEERFVVPDSKTFFKRPSVQNVFHRTSVYKF